METGPRLQLIEFEYVLNFIGLPLGYTSGSSATVPGTLGGANWASGGMLLQNVNVI